MPATKSHDRVWIIAYDVSSARSRRQLARILEGEALRIQKSVFSTECSQERMAGILQRGRRWLKPGDRLNAWPVLNRTGIHMPWGYAGQRLPGYWIA